MESVIKQVIDARKNAIFSSYNITDKNMLDKIDNLFNRINEFGEKYNDVSKFEAEFANNPLNSEYTNIFVELAQSGINASSPSVGEMMADRIGSEVKNSVLPSHAVVADARDNALRNIPVIGDAIDVGQKISFFGKFRKDK